MCSSFPFRAKVRTLPFSLVRNPATFPPVRFTDCALPSLSSPIHETGLQTPYCPCPCVVSLCKLQYIPVYPSPCELGNVHQPLCGLDWDHLVIKIVLEALGGLAALVTILAFFGIVPTDNLPFFSSPPLGSGALEKLAAWFIGFDNKAEFKDLAQKSYYGKYVN